MQVAFDDSYINYVRQIDFFYNIFVLIFTNWAVSFPKKFFSMTCTLRGKKDFLWFIYILYVCAIDIFQSSFAFVFINRTSFPQIIFLYDLYIERKKWCTYDLWWLIYTLCVQYLGFPKVVLCYFSLFKQLLLSKFFSMTFTLRGNKKCTNDLCYSCILYLSFI